MKTNKTAKLGLKENWQQFTLLVIINAFVGGMIGLERSILPQLAESEFGIGSHTAMLSFIITFGITKAFSNYFTGKFANRIGKKNLLTIGWLIGFPVPFLLIYAPTWSWVAGANILLGINQGLTWSSTVMMKIDLVGEKNRGLAMGLNEFAGYVAVGFIAFLTGYIAANYGVRPYPFYIGIALAAVGLVGSLLLVKDTHHHVSAESKSTKAALMKNVFIETTFTNKNLSAVTQAGLTNNLNDGMIWGLLPILLAQNFYGSMETGIVTAVYPAMWGIGQLFTGKMADHFNKKMMLFWGMFMQAIAIAGFAWSGSITSFIALSAILGIGTALVYPTFLAVVADSTHPQQRAESIGIFRLWRDSGYAVGALLTGIIADFFGLTSAILSVALLTLFSAVVIKFRMKEP